MLRRLLINVQPSFASIGYSHQQLLRVPRGTGNRHSQFRLFFFFLSKVKDFESSLVYTRHRGISPPPSVGPRTPLPNYSTNMKWEKNTEKIGFGKIQKGK